MRRNIASQNAGFVYETFVMKTSKDKSCMFVNNKYYCCKKLRQSKSLYACIVFRTNIRYRKLASDVFYGIAEYAVFSTMPRRDGR